MVKLDKITRNNNNYRNLLPVSLLGLQNGMLMGEETNAVIYNTQDFIGLTGVGRGNGFQIPGSPIFEGIQAFHDDLMVFLAFILGFVLYILVSSISTFRKKNEIEAGFEEQESFKFTHASLLEIIWTLIPAFILILIAIPSFSLLYSIDEIIEPFLTIKAIGHQWYWSYEYLNPEVIAVLYELENNSNVAAITSEASSNFDSYMLSDKEVVKLLKKDLIEYRLLAVDHLVDLPVRMVTHLLITSADVLHSWAVPSLGIKLDACPGRLNQTSVLVRFIGRYFGQCSELCGVNHGFMPICVNAFPIFRVKGVEVETLISQIVSDSHK